MTTITTLAQLIAHVESNNNPLAVRFEPEHVPATPWVFGMKQVAECSFATAKNLCSISWGKYQIMGDDLISLGLKISPLAYVQDDVMQDDFFQRYILADHLSLTLDDVLNNPAKRAMFARLYNGPGNITAYANRIVSVAQAHGLKVTP